MTRWVMSTLLAIAICAAAVTAQEPRSGAAAAALNLNTATVAQLEELPGIGTRDGASASSSTARRAGGFKKVEDLMNVKGIGEKSFLKLKPLVTVAQRSERASQ